VQGDGYECANIMYYGARFATPHLLSHLRLHAPVLLFMHNVRIFLPDNEARKRIIVYVNALFCVVCSRVGNTDVQAFREELHDLVKSIPLHRVGYAASEIHSRLSPRWSTRWSCPLPLPFRISMRRHLSVRTGAGHAGHDCINLVCVGNLLWAHCFTVYFRWCVVIR
jgi:hypothetical protein